MYCSITMVSFCVLRSKLIFLSQNSMSLQSNSRNQDNDRFARVIFTLIHMMKKYYIEVLYTI